MLRNFWMTRSRWTLIERGGPVARTTKVSTRQEWIFPAEFRKNPRSEIQDLQVEINQRVVSMVIIKRPLGSTQSPLLSGWISNCGRLVKWEQFFKQIGQLIYGKSSMGIDCRERSGIKQWTQSSQAQRASSPFAHSPGALLSKCLLLTASSLPRGNWCPFLLRYGRDV